MWDPEFLFVFFFALHSQITYILNLMAINIKKVGARKIGVESSANILFTITWN